MRLAVIILSLLWFVQPIWAGPTLAEPTVQVETAAPADSTDHAIPQTVSELRKQMEESAEGSGNSSWFSRFINHFNFKRHYINATRYVASRPDIRLPKMFFIDISLKDHALNLATAFGFSHGTEVIVALTSIPSAFAAWALGYLDAWQAVGTAGAGLAVGVPGGVDFFCWVVLGPYVFKPYQHVVYWTRQELSHFVDHKPPIAGLMKKMRLTEAMAHIASQQDKLLLNRGSLFSITELSERSASFQLITDEGEPSHKLDFVLYDDGSIGLKTVTFVTAHLPHDKASWKRLGRFLRAFGVNIASAVQELAEYVLATQERKPPSFATEVFLGAVESRAELNSDIIFRPPFYKLNFQGGATHFKSRAAQCAAGLARWIGMNSSF